MNIKPPLRAHIKRVDVYGDGHFQWHVVNGANLRVPNAWFESARKFVGQLNSKEETASCGQTSQSS